MNRFNFYSVFQYRPGIFFFQIFILITFLTSTSCEKSGDGPYKAGEKQSFDVFVTDTTVHFSSLTLEVSQNTFFLFQQKVIWRAQFDRTDGSSVAESSTTGVMQNENKVWLHPPRVGSLEFLEAFPFPEVRFPLEIGKTWKNSISVASGFEELNGKTIHSDYEIISDDAGVNGPEEDEIWEIHAQSFIDGDDRKFEAIYVFHHEDGFIGYTYLIDSVIFAEVKLISLRVTR